MTTSGIIVACCLIAASIVFGYAGRKRVREEEKEHEEILGITTEMEIETKNVKKNGLSDKFRDVFPGRIK